VEINSVWEMIREDINISAKESLGYYGLRSISHGSTKGAQSY
jgi:hypothetical protein